MSTVVASSNVADLCRTIYSVIVNTDGHLGQAFAGKHHLRGYFSMEDGKVSGCLAGISRRVRADADALRQQGDNLLADELLKRLQLVCQ